MEPSIKNLTLRDTLTKVNSSNYPYEIPFSAFLIVPIEKNQIVYFTQSLAQFLKIHPSIQDFKFPEHRDNEFSLLKTLTGRSYKIILFNLDQTLDSSIWLENCIHELRTSSLILNLGKKIPYTTSLLKEKLGNASKRQELATIVASDLLQLLGTPQKIQRITLPAVLYKASFGIGDRSHTIINILEKAEIDSTQLCEPIIWGNSHFLENFFRTILFWCSQPINIEVKKLNPLAISLSILFHDSEDLTQRIGYRLIWDYISYISAYFNFRSWILPNRVQLILPAVLTPREF